MPKVLIVDDNANFRELTCSILKMYGLIDNEEEIITVKNGASGIIAAVDEKPDVILLDVKLPDMSGFDVCTTLKTQFETSKIPIILITGYAADGENRLRGLKAGAVAFLQKPVNNEELVAQIRVVLALKRNGKNGTLATLRKMTDDLINRDGEIAELLNKLTKANQELRDTKAKLEERVKELDRLYEACKLDKTCKLEESGNAK